MLSVPLLEDTSFVGASPSSARKNLPKLIRMGVFTVPAFDFEYGIFNERVFSQFMLEITTDLLFGSSK